MDSPFERQVNDPDEFDFSSRFFNSCEIEFVSIDSISPVDFFFPFEVDIIDYKSMGLSTIESSSVDFALVTPFV